jgi:hypothetical protein
MVIHVSVIRLQISSPDSLSAERDFTTDWISAAVFFSVLYQCRLSGLTGGMRLLIFVLLSERISFRTKQASSRSRLYICRDDGIVAGRSLCGNLTDAGCPSIRAKALSRVGFHVASRSGFCLISLVSPRQGNPRPCNEDLRGGSPRSGQIALRPRSPWNNPGKFCG